MKRSYWYGISTDSWVQRDLHPIQAKSVRDIILLALATFRPKTASHIQLADTLDIRIQQPLKSGPRHYAITWYEQEGGNKSMDAQVMTIDAATDADAAITVLGMDLTWPPKARVLVLTQHPDSGSHSWILRLLARDMKTRK